MKNRFHQRGYNLLFSSVVTTAVVLGAVAVATSGKTASSRCDLVIGSWNWPRGRTATFSAGGGASARGEDIAYRGSWRCLDPQTGRVEIKWLGGLFTTWVTPTDVRSLKGDNVIGERFTASRIEAASKTSSKVSREKDKGQRPRPETRAAENKTPQKKTRSEKQREDQRPQVERDNARTQADSAETTGLPLYVLTPAAKVEFDAGLAAAERQNWQDAINRLTAAQIRSPAFPPILFNLGLAHLAAGNEVPAIYWLEAYLATFPADRTMAEQQIAAALANAEAKMRTILDAALQLGKEIGETRHIDVAIVYAGKLKDIDAAWRALRKPDGGIDEFDADLVRLNFAEGLVAAREDVDGALAVVSMIKDSTKRDSLKSIISQALLLRRNIDRAIEIAATIENPNDRAYAQFNILADFGSFNESRINELSALIEKAVGYKKTEMQGVLVDRLIHIDQIERARKLLEQMQADKIATFYAFGSVAESYLERGNEAAARALARQARDAARAAKNGTSFGLHAPLLLLWLCDDVADEAERIRDSYYFYYRIRYQALIGQFENARASLDGATRALAEPNRRGAERGISHGIDLRVRRLLGEGKLSEARTLLRRHPREGCTAAYLHVAEFEIGLANLGDALATIEAIPRGRAPLDLRDDCVTERAQSLVRLARAQITAGDATAAAATAAKAAALIWRGALTEGIIEGVAGLYDESGNDEGSTWVRSNLGFIPLREEWILRAQLASTSVLLTHFADRIQQIRQDDLKADKLSMLPADLAWTASRLGSELHNYDVIKRRRGRQK